ncbi:type II toxin-antitoxin system VapC family toxin [Rhizobium sullae]|uniref:type II toxin-antitoxin system VapC family toxin n=1 Tax=Rhizobium sullae TaxID=50338 RepID=UPI000B34AD52|nr:type II toxin-antitoxin system VapC family toxin [Rhizobium sullae]
MFYVDTSVLITVFSPETQTTRVLEWLSRNRDASISISDWTITEFSSAMSLKIRNSMLIQDDRNQALKVFKEFRESIFECLEVPRGCFIEAARLSDRHDTSLRSGDALHMAVAHHYGLTLLTRDKGLAKAAAVIGAQHQW